MRMLMYDGCSPCRPRIAAWLLMLSMLGGCATQRPAPPAPSTPAQPSATPADHTTSKKDVYERGEASYYAHSFAGQETASGEHFNPKALTAAHRSLPFGTRVRVTNESNKRHVTVRINDRGPYADGRIIDLSPAAARRLHMKDDGTTRVSLRIVSQP